MLKLLTILSLIVLTGCSPASSINLYCASRLPDSQIEVVGEVAPYVVANNSTMAELTNELNASSDRVSAGRVMGLTNAAYRQDVSISLYRVRGLGFICGRPQVKVVLTVPEPVVSIARELTPGSCRYNEVMTHEERHVNAYQQQLEETTLALKTAFLLRHPAKNIVLLKSDKDVIEWQKTELNTWLVPALESSIANVKQKNLLIDTPQEYQRLTAVCPEETLVPIDSAAGPAPLAN